MRHAPEVIPGACCTIRARARPLAAEVSPHLLGIGLELWDGGTRLGPIEDLDLYVNDDPTGTLEDVAEPDDRGLSVVGVLNERSTDSYRCVWRGSFDTLGRVEAAHDLDVRRGYGALLSLSQVLEQNPPTIYFLDGTTTIGAVRYDSRSRPSSFDVLALGSISWDLVDITAETRATAAKRGAGVRSIHERLEQYLQDSPRIGEHRWILCNDGAGEIADYLVIEELPTGEIALALWHAKAAKSAAPSVRIGDFQIVVAQAIRSRSTLPSTALWDQLARRLDGRESPEATVVDGSDDPAVLRRRLGLETEADAGGDEPAPWTRSLPVIRGTIGIAQPGLSAGQLRGELDRDSASPAAIGLRQLFSVLQDAAISDGVDLRLLVSE
jgi:hypothetical protein